MHIKLKKNYLKVFIISFLLFICAILLADWLMFPMVRSASSQISKQRVDFIINRAVLSVIESNSNDYSNIVTFEKDASGKIVAMKTNSYKMNRLKSEISLQIHDELSRYSQDEIYIPLGNIFKNSLITGRGPKIKICIRPANSIVCDYRNVFESAGINQTNHRVMVDITASIYVIMPFRSEKSSVKTSVCVSDTVIIGEIPEAFTNVQNYNTENDTGISDDVMDFGAHNNLG